MLRFSDYKKIQSAFSTACQDGDIKKINDLFQRYPNINLNTADLVALFLNSGKINLNTINKQWYMACFYEACQFKKFDIIGLFLKHHLKENPHLFYSSPPLFADLYEELCWNLMKDLCHYFNPVANLKLLLSSENLKNIELSIMTPSLKEISIELPIAYLEKIFPLAKNEWEAESLAKRNLKYA
jgi:hypothetical protein